MKWIRALALLAVGSINLAAQAVPVQYIVDGLVSGNYSYGEAVFDVNGNHVVDQTGNWVFNDVYASVDQRMVMIMDGDTDSVVFSGYTPASPGRPEHAVFTQPNFSRVALLFPDWQQSDPPLLYPMFVANPELYLLQADNYGPAYIRSSDGQQDNIGQYLDWSFCLYSCEGSQELIAGSAQVAPPSSFSPRVDLARSFLANSPQDLTVSMNDVLLDTRGPFTDRYRYGQLEIFSFNQATFAVSPIPEPETYALMLAGLGAAFIRLRRRRAQGGSPRGLLPLAA